MAKSIYTSIDTNFSDPKLKKAYAKLRKAFDQGKELRENVIDPAKDEFEALLKPHLVKKGEAESEDLLKIGHQYGLAFTVLDEPEEPKAARTKKRVVRV